MIELTNRECAALWFDGVAEKTDRLTSGNISHQGNTIKALARDSAEFLEKWGEKSDPLLQKAVHWFKNIVDDCDHLTSGNISHQRATIKGRAIRCADYIRKHINDK